MIKINALIEPRMAPVLTVVFTSEDLRRNVVGCSTESTGGITWSDPLLSGRRTTRKGKKCKSNPNSGCMDKRAAVEDVICGSVRRGRGRKRGPVSTCSRY